MSKEFILYNKILLKEFLFLEIIQQQNEKIMEALASQHVLTKILIKQDEFSNNLSESFPIKTMEDLERVENQINENNNNLYVSKQIEYFK